ncbi:TPA: IS630 family transposase, partial [Streptococcus suis]
GFKNRVFKTLESVIDQLQTTIQGLHWSDLKSIVHREWTSRLFDF